MKIKCIAFLLLITGISYSQEYNGNVGIGTDDPKNTLDIRGDLKVIPDDLKDNSTYSGLYRIENASNGEHKIVKKGNYGIDIPAKDKSYYSFNLTIKLTKSNSNKCKFDTKVPSDKYNLLIINSELQDLSGNPVAISHISESEAKQQGQSWVIQNSPKRVLLTKSDDNTWVIEAGFPYTSAVTIDSSNKTQWVFSLFAIPRSDSKLIDPNPTKSGSLRGDSYKLDERMFGSGINDPLQNVK